MSKDYPAKHFVEQIHRRKKEELLKNNVVDIDELRKLKKYSIPRNILVVDDDPSVRNSLRRILELDGYNVLLASEGADLSTAVSTHDLSIILLDINLPWIDGYELCKLMKADEVLRSIPVIFVSGYKSKNHIKRGFDVGCDDYITKPFNIEDISRAVKTLLKINEK